MMAFANLEDGGLGVYVLPVDSSAHVECRGSNGLPLAPSSIRIAGNFERVRSLQHRCLCAYVDVICGKHDQIFLVSEYHPLNLSQVVGRFRCFETASVKKILAQILMALDYLHCCLQVHGCLSLENVMLTRLQGDAKLSAYGLYGMTDNGTSVNYPLCNPRYMSPEMMLGTLKGGAGPPSDIWAFGIILLEVILDARLFSEVPVGELVRWSLDECKKAGLDGSLARSVLHRFGASGIDTGEVFTDELFKLAECCLRVRPSSRPSAAELLADLDADLVYATPKAPDPSLVDLKTVFGIKPRASTLTPEMLRELLREPDELTFTYPLSTRPYDEVYTLWRLAGSDLESILTRSGHITAQPPILRRSFSLFIDDNVTFGREEARETKAHMSIVPLSMKLLNERLESVDPEYYFPVLELKYVGAPEGIEVTDFDPSKLPRIIKEKDIEYQLRRQILFRRLIEAYPFKRSWLWQEARVDIPPLYRNYVWAALLDVKGDIREVYDAVDKDTPTPTDRQIEVDIPRCHQYDQLLASPVGHRKFKRILKAWILTNPQYVYWQGLDSLCAPFLFLNFNNEPLAFACLSAFIPKYLHNFFLKDNSQVLREYFAIFNHLMAYHEPKLCHHMNEIGFEPQLYAMPWFLTMFSHVFPLAKTFHLWDTLLLGNHSFPLFVGVAILLQLRDRLMQCGFNECILLFSDLPEINI